MRAKVGRPLWGFSAMPTETLRKVGRGAAAAAAACLVGLCLSPAPASAGDDGAAPIWDSVRSVFSFAGGGDEDQPQIDYRDHARLVVPPKMELPPPAAAPMASATDWPRDPEVVAVKKRKAEEAAAPNVPLRVRDKNLNITAVSSTDVVTTPYTAGMGPSRRCVEGPGKSCDSTPKPSLNWNPLTWVGVEKKPQTVLGPEPERDSLTDPPVGYRAPAEGVGVKIDTN